MFCDLHLQFSQMFCEKCCQKCRSDEGLTLETSAFRISVRWPIYIINSVDKTKIFVYFATDAAPQFL